MRLRILLCVLACCTTVSGCGTTKWTDSSRTATEQLLLSDSMDRAVSKLDLRAVAGKTIFVDDGPVKGMTDAAYLVSTLRQHVMASGGILKEKKDEADYVLEVRAGAIGTDRHDLLFGIPATTIPSVPTITSGTSQIPEIAFAKKTDQRAVAKIGMFMYNRSSGRIVWQSRVMPDESKAKAVWVFGAGPFQRGRIYGETRFAGDRVHIPLVSLGNGTEADTAALSVADEAFFVEPKTEATARNQLNPSVLPESLSPTPPSNGMGIPTGPPPTGAATAAPNAVPEAGGVVQAGLTTAAVGESPLPADPFAGRAVYEPRQPAGSEPGFDDREGTPPLRRGDLRGSVQGFDPMPSYWR